MEIDLEDVVLRNCLQLLDDVSYLMCVLEDKTLIIKLDKMALSLAEVVGVLNESL